MVWSKKKKSEPLKIKGSLCAGNRTWNCCCMILVSPPYSTIVLYQRFLVSGHSSFFLSHPKRWGISEGFWNTDQSNCISDIPGFLSKDELENRQPMADCRKELLMEIGVSEQPKRHKPLFYKGSKQYGTIWENLEKRQLHSQLHSNCIQLWPLCA